MYCQECGAQNDDQAAFCDKCGATLQKAAPTAGTTATAYTAAVQYAGFWRRFAAVLIDGLILGAVQTVIQVILMGVGVITVSDAQATPGTEDYNRYLSIVLILSGVMFVIQILYFAVMESSSKQATLGKMVLGIVVTDTDGKRVSLGRAVGRNLAKVISTIILLIGFIMIAFTEKKQGLHDMMANCLVIVKR